MSDLSQLRTKTVNLINEIPEERLPFIMQFVLFLKNQSEDEFLSDEQAKEISNKIYKDYDGAFEVLGQ